MFGTGFGQTSSSLFGTQRPTGGLFGNQDNKPIGFGTSTGQTGPFGATTTLGGFGQSATSSSLFGRPQGMFGQQQPTGMFGQQSTGVFGTPASTFGGFGQPQQQQQPAFGGGLFGNTQQTQSAFGNLGQQPAVGLFGQSQPSLFGQTQPTAQTSLFGTPTPSTGGLFGTTSSSLFGQQPATQSSLFGTPQTASTFGGTSLFGASQPQTTSSLFGTPIIGGQKSGGTSSLTWREEYSKDHGGKVMAICFQGGINQEKSLEELRTEDYSAGGTPGRTPQSTGGLFGGGSPTLFGQQQAGAGTGLFGTAQPAVTSPFGQQSSTGSSLFRPAGSLFGQQQQQPAFGGGLFGTAQQTPSAFGGMGQAQQPATGGGLFGQSQPSLFGQTQPTTQTSLFGTPPPSTGGLFGTTSSSLFGQQPATQSSLFGTPQTASTFGGTSLFGASQPQTTSSLFGASPSFFGAASTSSLFGQSPATGGSLFGTATQPASQSSLFGPKPAGLFDSKPTNIFGTSQTPAPTLFGQTTGSNLFGSGASLFGTPATPAPSPTQQVAPVYDPYGLSRLAALMGPVGPVNAGETPLTFATHWYASPVSGPSSGVLVPRTRRPVSRWRPAVPELIGDGRRGQRPVSVLRTPRSSIGTSSGRVSVESYTAAGTPSPMFSQALSPWKRKHTPRQSLFPPVDEVAMIPSDEPVLTEAAANRQLEDLIFLQLPMDRCVPLVSSIESSRPPKLMRPLYHTRPSMATLSSYTNAQLSQVEDFTVVHENHGEVTWPGTTDVRGLDLDGIVLIDNKSIELYINVEEPAVGTGLNKKAIVSLRNCCPKDYAKANELTQTERDAICEKHSRKLRDYTERLGGRFIGLSLPTWTWKFEVDHFSRYSARDVDFLLDDDAQSDADELPATRVVKLTTVPKVVGMKKQYTPFSDISHRFSQLGHQFSLGVPLDDVAQSIRFRPAICPNPQNLFASPSDRSVTVTNSAKSTRRPCYATYLALAARAAIASSTSHKSQTRESLDNFVQSQVAAAKRSRASIPACPNSSDADWVASVEDLWDLVDILVRSPVEPRTAECIPKEWASNRSREILFGGWLEGVGGRTIEKFVKMLSSEKIRKKGKFKLSGDVEDHLEPPDLAFLYACCNKMGTAAEILLKANFPRLAILLLATAGGVGNCQSNKLPMFRQLLEWQSNGLYESVPENILRIYHLAAGCVDSLVLGKCPNWISALTLHFFHTPPEEVPTSTTPDPSLGLPSVRRAIASFDRSIELCPNAPRPSEPLSTLQIDLMRIGVGRSTVSCGMFCGVSAALSWPILTAVVGWLEADGRDVPNDVMSLLENFRLTVVEELEATGDWDLALAVLLADREPTDVTPRLVRELLMRHVGVVIDDPKIQFVTKYVGVPMLWIFEAVGTRQSYNGQFLQAAQSWLAAAQTLVPAGGLFVDESPRRSTPFLFDFMSQATPDPTQDVKTLKEDRNLAATFGEAIQQAVTNAMCPSVLPAGCNDFVSILKIDGRSLFVNKDHLLCFLNWTRRQESQELFSLARAISIFSDLSSASVALSWRRSGGSTLASFLGWVDSLSSWLGQSSASSPGWVDDGTPERCPKGDSMKIEFYGLLRSKATKAISTAAAVLDNHLTTDDQNSKTIAEISRILGNFVNLEYNEIDLVLF